MIAVLLDQVTAYAAAVRSHLADLTPEQVDDLTDGLEADLAEAIEDAPAGGGAPSTADASILDLDKRFGPAAEYAAELRSAAGLEAGDPAPRRRPWREAVRATGEHWRAKGATLTRGIAGVPGGRWLVDTVPLMRPVWWLLRGWVWFVIVGTPVTIFLGTGGPFVPTNVIGWLLLGVILVLSVEHGQGHLDGRRPARAVLAVADVVAVLAVVPLLWNFALDARTDTVYIDNGAPFVEQPIDGVVVDGMFVSNLFVYDAQGNPLHDVQIVDDRGRQVRTIPSQDGQEWMLPGVNKPWAFAPSSDVDGRDRWNVYPLLGAPVDEWIWTQSGERELDRGSALETPPYPFAKAPALRTTAGTSGQPAVDPSAAPTTDAAPGGTEPTDTAPTGEGAVQTPATGSEATVAPGPTG